MVRATGLKHAPDFNEGLSGLIKEDGGKENGYSSICITYFSTGVSDGNTVDGSGIVLLRIEGINCTGADWEMGTEEVAESRS